MVLAHDTSSHCALQLYEVSFKKLGTEWTQNCIYKCSKGNNVKNIQAEVMVLEHYMSSQCALQMYEVSSKIS